MRSLDAFRQELLDSRPGFRRAWEASEPKRNVALALVRLRTQAGRTQTQVAEAAGWDKGFVSRLEATAGPVPDIATITRYAAACESVVGLVFASVAAGTGAAHVIESVSLATPTDVNPFETLRDQELPLEPARKLVTRER